MNKKYNEYKKRIIESKRPTLKRQNNMAGMPEELSINKLIPEEIKLMKQRKIERDKKLKAEKAEFKQDTYAFIRSKEGFNFRQNALMWVSKYREEFIEVND